MPTVRDILFSWIYITHTRLSDVVDNTGNVQYGDALVNQMLADGLIKAEDPKKLLRGYIKKWMADIQKKSSPYTAVHSKLMVGPWSDNPNHPCENDLNSAFVAPSAAKRRISAKAGKKAIKRAVNKATKKAVKKAAKS